MPTKKIKKKTVDKPAATPSDESLGLEEVQQSNGQAEEPVVEGKAVMPEVLGVLPIGIDVGEGKLDKGYELNDFDGEMEMGLARYRDANQSIDHSKFVTYLMGMAISRLGPHDFSSMKPIEKELILGGLYMADILHMYIHFRMASIGNAVPMKVQCLHCRSELDIRGDLSTLETKTAADLASIHGKVKLGKPIPFLHGDNEIDLETLEIKPARWSVLQSSDGAGAQYKALVSLVQDCVVPGGGDLPPGLFFTDFLFKKLTKLDIEAIKAKILEVTPGPLMMLEGSCSKPGCGRKFSFPLEWTYDAFFTISSP